MIVLVISTIIGFMLLILLLIHEKKIMSWLERNRWELM